MKKEEPSDAEMQPQLGAVAATGKGEGEGLEGGSGAPGGGEEEGGEEGRLVPRASGRLWHGFVPGPNGEPPRGALVTELRKMRLLGLQQRLRREVRRSCGLWLRLAVGNSGHGGAASGGCRRSAATTDVFGAAAMARERWRSPP